jgi:2,6-dihydroxypyridine 3-monooxygenase
MASFEQDAGGVRASFAGGWTLDVDLLVCADGVGSTARRILQPEASSTYAGYVAWRGMVPENDLPPGLVCRFGDAITYHVTANSHVLVYPIPGRDGSVESGARLVNFVWYRNYLDGGDLDDLMTDRDGVRRELSLPPGAVSARHDTEARATARARLPPSIAAVIEATEHLFVQVIHDIAVDRMAFGRVCLLGDAAFAVRPHAAAGTAKAADDGWALAEALDAAADVPAALAAWEPGRLAVGRQLLDRTRRIGRRSQVDNAWVPGDPELIFGLHRPGTA